jgi:hypothetical protein
LPTATYEEPDVVVMLFSNTTGYVAGKKFETKGIHHETEAELYYNKLQKNYHMPEYKYTTKSELISALSGKRLLLDKDCTQLTDADKLVGIACDANAEITDQPISACYSPEYMFQRTQLYLFLRKIKPIMYPRKGFYPRIRDLVAHLLVSDSTNISGWSFGSLPSSQNVTHPYFKAVLLTKKTAYDQLTVFGFNSEYAAEDNCYLFCLKLSICNRKLHLRAQSGDPKGEYLKRIQSNKLLIETRIKGIAKQCYSSYCAATGDIQTFSKYLSVFRPAALTLFCYDYLWPHYSAEEIQKDFTAEVPTHFAQLTGYYNNYSVFRNQSYAQMYLASDRNSVKNRAEKVLAGATKPKEVRFSPTVSRNMSPESMISETVSSKPNSLLDRFKKLSLGGSKKSSAALAKEHMAKRLADKKRAGDLVKDKNLKDGVDMDDEGNLSVRSLNDTVMGIESHLVSSRVENFEGNMLDELKQNP